MTAPANITVLGSGSWGTTVASIACTNARTTLWARREGVAREIAEQRTNADYTGDHRLPESLQVTSDLEEAVARADVLVCGVPSQYMRGVLEEAEPYVRPWIPVVSLVKGLEPESRLRPTEVIAELLPGHPVGLLAGPNIASEILEGLAAAAVIATPDLAVAQALQPLFSTVRFRVYTHSDVLGCELGGVLKNIIAIAAGMADGLGVGVNTSALVISRGLAEIIRIGTAMGAEATTFSGLTGMGDLIATCMSEHSRNRRVGQQIAEGRTIQEAVEVLGQVAEGVKTARSVMALAHELGVEAPITVEVDAVVNEGRTAAQAYRGLLRIRPGHEHDAG